MATSVARWNGLVIVSVKDSGIGIAAEFRDRIFDRFYRIDDTRARETGGSGLGLAIAQRSALALDGRIEVDSAPGVGSEFRLLLPAPSAVEDERDPTPVHVRSTPCPPRAAARSRAPVVDQP